MTQSSIKVLEDYLNDHLHQVFPDDMEDRHIKVFATTPKGKVPYYDKVIKDIKDPEYLDKLAEYNISIISMRLSELKESREYSQKWWRRWTPKHSLLLFQISVESRDYKRRIIEIKKEILERNQND